MSFADDEDSYQDSGKIMTSYLRHHVIFGAQFGKIFSVGTILEFKYPIGTLNHLS